MTRAPGKAPGRRAWAPPLMLFVYAAAFSFAYLRLSIGAGALILFGSVQVTMMLAGLKLGERPGIVQWAGIAAAFGGLVFLVLPGLSAPPLGAAALMASAGAAWGAYSLFGRRVTAALPATSVNFARSVPPALVVMLLAMSHVHLTPAGTALAVASGAAASGLGYVAWYAVLPRLTATRAAAVQLAVPVLAAATGVVMLGEALTARLVVSGAAILGGIALALTQRNGGGS
jgi:drug/metabolite transporter (DMT)-like permease